MINIVIDREFFMFIFCLVFGCVGSLVLLCVSVLVCVEILVLLIENLVLFNMVVNGGNYVKDDGISGISIDIVCVVCECV